MNIVQVMLHTSFHLCDLVFNIILLTIILFADSTKIIHTEMMLAPEEFDNYQIGVDTDVTFCLKELRVDIMYM